ARPQPPSLCTAANCRTCPLMRGFDVLDLNKAVNSLVRHRHRWDKLMQAAARQTSPQSSDSAQSHLREVKDFGSNPGALRMFTYVPERLVSSPALVVVLHGCTQNAA